MCTYGLLTEERDGLPVLSTVLYLERCATPASPWRQLGPAGRVIHEFTFSVVRLWEEPVADWLAAGQVGLLPFVPFLSGATIDDLEPVAEALQEIPDPSQRDSSIFYTISFANRVFTPAVVNAFLRRNPMLDTFLRESPLYQEILEEGAEQEARKTILLIVEQRFPTLLAEAAKHIATITNIDQLRTITATLVSIQDEDAVRALFPLSR
jgi:predicted transposase YdaD